MALEPWQQNVLLSYALYGVYAIYRGFRECKYHKNAYGFTPHLYILGAFVWGDALVFGFFWIIISLSILIIADWLLFLLILSIFWSVRGIGETIFWFNQQFSTIHRYPAHTLPGYSIVGNDSIWFIYQIAAQCITVVALIFSIYFGALWVSRLYVL